MMKPFQYLSPIMEFEYIRPTTIESALSILDQHRGGGKIIAGGTDLTIALKNNSIKPSIIIDITGLRNELNYIKDTGNEIRIGSMTTFDEIYNSAVINNYAACLSDAAYAIGTWQIRNMATIGGNIANASPAADSAPPLIALSATVTLKSIEGTRTIPIEEAFKGPKKSTINDREMITEISFKKIEGIKSSWIRIGRRNANTISVVSVAMAASVVENHFNYIKVGLGSVGPTPLFAKSASDFLKGKPISRSVISQAAELAMKDSSPITDIRGTKEYRLKMVRFLTFKLLNKFIEGI